MAVFSNASKRELDTCHTDLQTLFNEVIKQRDCSVLQGFRNKEEQNKAYEEGKSQKKWPNGNHNKNPSTAVDVIPFPIDWNDREGITYFAGYVLGIAEGLIQTGKITHKLRWGGDWNSDGQVKDNKFDDLVHFELVI